MNLSIQELPDKTDTITDDSYFIISKLVSGIYTTFKVKFRYIKEKFLNPTITIRTLIDRGYCTVNDPIFGTHINWNTNAGNSNIGIYISKTSYTDPTLPTINNIVINNPENEGYGDGTFGYGYNDNSGKFFCNTPEYAGFINDSNYWVYGGGQQLGYSTYEAAQNALRSRIVTVTYDT